MSDFNRFNLSEALLKAISDLNFTTPTPVQEAVLPLIINERRDLTVLAQTGTGKTAAFGLPLIETTNCQEKTIQSVILCPTRELCVQIAKDLTAFSKYHKGLQVLAVYGGASIDTQIKALKKGVQVVAATPGRMNDLINRGVLKLSSVHTLVLDEADEMLNMGFQEELEAIMTALPTEIRKPLFSATMGSEVARIAGKYMREPQEIIIGTKNAGSENVIHECYTVHARDRYEALKRILDNQQNIYGIIFCRTRMETQDIATALIADGYTAEPLHGDLSQDQRDRVMKKFRAKVVTVLVATDVAARGIDVNNLTHVINYNLPDESEAYTHRSGRTGRAGKSGISIVISTPSERFKVRFIERIIKKKFVQKKVPSGNEVCQTQLMGLLSRIKSVEVASNGEEAFSSLGPFMPAIVESFEGMNADEIIKRFLLLEFNKFLDYYKDARDLNLAPAPERSREQGRGSFTGAGRRGNSSSNAGSSSGSGSGTMLPLKINFGRNDKFSPSSLITLINSNTKGSKFVLGKISIGAETSTFEVLDRDSDYLIKALNRSQFNNNRIVVDLAREGAPAKQQMWSRSRRR